MIWFFQIVVEIPLLNKVFAAFFLCPLIFGVWLTGLSVYYSIKYKKYIVPSKCFPLVAIPVFFILVLIIGRIPDADSRIKMRKTISTAQSESNISMTIDGQQVSQAKELDELLAELVRLRGNVGDHSSPYRDRCLEIVVTTKLETLKLTLCPSMDHSEEFWVFKGLEMGTSIKNRRPTVGRIDDATAFSKYLSDQTIWHEKTPDD